jgi:hypothetical protein
MRQIRARAAAAAVGALALGALALGACSDDETATATTTTAGGDGTLTTAEITTTTTAGADASVVRALAAVGTWTGTWTNDTFGSTGPASMTLSVDEEAQTLDATLDIGGNVFGGADPDAETFSIPLLPGTYEGSSPVFGSYAVTLNADATLEVVATEMPAIPAGTFTVSASVVGDNFSGTYEVDFGDGREPATGRFELIQQPAAT